MTTGADLRTLANSRLASVKLLITNGDYDGAVYLIGYVLEYALKAVVCKKLNLIYYPDNAIYKGERGNLFKTHSFDILITLCGLSQFMTITNAPKRLYENWSELTKWTTATRYQPIGTYTEQNAKRMLEALEESPDGVLTWIRGKGKW